MTTTTNLFPNFNSLTKTNPTTYNLTSYTKNNVGNGLETFTPGLTQGDKFKKYQRKIKKNLEKRENINSLSGKEGFDGLNLDNMNLDKNGLAIESNNIITSNEYSSEQQSTLQNLRQQYQAKLKEYNDLLQKYTGSSKNYFKRVSSSNPYSGKNVCLTGGACGYVTNQGVFKWYPADNNYTYNNTAGKNGCPNSAYIGIDGDISSDGTTITSNPPLINGTPMVAGQSCGNEGKNVFVNTMVSNSSSSYVGCYQDQPAPTLINFAPKMNSSNSANGFRAQASSVYFNNNSFTGPWNAFDRNQNTWWHSNVVESIGNTSTSYDKNTGVYIGTNSIAFLSSNNENKTVKGEWLSMICPSEYTLTGYSILGRQGCCGQPNGRDPNTWYILGLGSNGSWVQLDYQANQSFNWKKMTYNISNPKPYIAYAIITTIAGDAAAPAGSRSCVQIAEWEMLTNVASTNSSTSAMIWNPNVIGYATPEQCKSYATQNGYKYYGLQSPKSDGTAACLVSQDIARAQMYGAASKFTPINVWASYTNNGTSASLTKYGVLTVYNSSSTAVYTSGTGTATATTPQNSYIGCYNDCISGRGLPTPIAVGTDAGSDYSKCSAAAQKGNWKYFGLQFTQSSNTSECWVGNDLDKAKSMGTTNNCSTVNGYSVGLSCSNAVYTTTASETGGSPFFLILQDDGNMCIYKGTSPSDNQGGIWCSMTNGKQQTANPQFAASKGKYGQNWIASGSTLAPGDFVGSTNGNMYLMMQTDGNLVLNTFTQGPACPKNSSGTTFGGDNINAIYEVSQVGITGNIAKLAYVDENANLHNYPNNNVKYGNTYTEISRGMDTPGNDVPGAAYGNATLQSCETTCNNNPNCAGIVTNAAGTTCWPKTSGMYPYSSDLTANSDRIIYMRNKTPLTTPIGVPKTTDNIDTIQYQHYVNGGNLSDRYGLSKLTSVQKQQLQSLLSQLDLLSQQITDYTNHFGSGSKTAELQMKKNVKGLVNNLTDLIVTDATINDYGTNMDLILNDSDIVALQKNYDYLFWTILAAGTVLVAINLIKK
jgi:hypothetical protein